MPAAGQIVLFRFPQTDLEAAKLRPALLIGQLPGEFDDWLMAMISTQLRHAVPDFDETIQDADPDFAASGLKSDSVVRVGRLAVVQASMLLGAVGQISPERLQRIRRNLASWLTRS